MPDKSYTNGEYIFREGESAAFAYVIKSGIVEIVKNSASGVQVLAELTPPSIFGEMALIDGNPRSAGARAKENSVVTEVTAAAFSSYLSKNPEAAIRIMKNISENLRSSNQLVAKYERAEVHSTDLDSELTVLDKNTKDLEIDDTDAIYERKPSKPILILVVTLLTFLLGSVLYASLSQVDTTISARGEFLTATPNIIVEASASSVVKSVEVERGDTVSKDQIIAYLDDTMVQVNLKQNEEKIDNIVQALISLYMEEFLVNNIQMFTENFNFDQLKAFTYKPLSAYPFIKFDLSFSVPNDFQASDLINCIESILDENENNISIFDNFTNEKTRNLGIRIVTRSYEKTYTETESTEILEMIVKEAESKFKIKLNKKDENAT